MLPSNALLLFSAQQVASAQSGNHSYLHPTV